MRGAPPWGQERETARRPLANFAFAYRPGPKSYTTRYTCAKRRLHYAECGATCGRAREECGGNGNDDDGASTARAPPMARLQRRRLAVRWVRTANNNARGAR